MKKYFYQLLFIAVLIVAGCGEDDPCKDVVCGPGTCEEGTCVCPEGYEGSSCEIFTKEKYFGDYIASYSECVNFLTLEFNNITLSSKEGGGPFDVSVSIDPDSDTLDGTLENGELNVSGDFGLVFTITGTFSDENNFSGVFEVDLLGSCKMTMSR